MTANQCVSCGAEMPEGDMICRKCGVEPSDFERYQRQALRTANDFHTGKDWLCNVGLGLAGEAGEVADLIKKIAFHGHLLDRDKLMDEMGDVLWAINKDGKAVININGEQTNTIFRHCPRCGRQLSGNPEQGEGI